VTCVFFPEAGFCRFAGGFGKKWVFECGFLMVNLWWIRGESWFVDGGFFVLKNTPRISDLFLRGSCFGL
jgi:hypothetical protein